MLGENAQNAVGGIAVIYVGFPALTGEERSLADMCSSRGYAVAGVYRENDDKEPFGVLKQLLKNADNSVFDILAVYDPSRTGSAAGSAIMEGLFRNYNVRTVFARKETRIVPAVLRAYFSMYANLYYKPGLSERYGPSLPAGYRLINGRIAVAKSEARAIAEIFEKFLAGAPISDELLHRAGGRSLREILRERRYTGAVCDEGARKYFVLPQIIDEETFEAVRGMLVPPPENYPLLDVLPKGAKIVEDAGRTYYVSDGIAVEKERAERTVFAAIREYFKQNDLDKLSFAVMKEFMDLYGPANNSYENLTRAEEEYSKAPENEKSTKLKFLRRARAEHERAEIMRNLIIHPMHFGAYLTRIFDEDYSETHMTDAVAHFALKVVFANDGDIRLTPVDGLIPEDDNCDFLN